MTRSQLEISATIGNRVGVPRELVRDWEAARLPEAARKIGLTPPVGDLDDQRKSFTDEKIALAAADIRQRLKRDLRVSELVARAMVRLSGGRRALSICELQVTGGGAADFVAWFGDTARSDYSRSMVAAHPDHFLIDTAADGVGNARKWGRSDARKRGHRFVVVQSAVSWVLMLGRVSIPRLRSR